MNRYTVVGNKIASISFESLQGNLKATVNKRGPSEAILFCNKKALPLTDSLSNAINAKIKRTSLKIINRKNEPDSHEAYMLDLYQ